MYTEASEESIPLTIMMPRMASTKSPVASVASERAAVARARYVVAFMLFP